jgi:hypothetical protein
MISLSNQKQASPVWLIPMAVSNNIGQNVVVGANRCFRWLAVGWVSVVIVTAAAVGQMSEPSGDDYWVRPIVLSRLVSVLVVTGAVIGLVASIFKWWRTRLIVSRKGIGGLAITAALTGFGYRLITAAESGANIGAGLYAMFVGPVILVWFVLACVSLQKSSRR